MIKRIDTLSNSFLVAVIIVVIACIYSLLSYWTPTALDDWIFMAEWRDINPSENLSINSLITFWNDIRLYDNGRLSNTLSPVFSIYSPFKEIFPFMTGIFCVSIITFISYFSFNKRGFSLFCIILSWTAAVYLLPWRNSLFVADYSLNYIWTAALTMLLILLVVRFERNKWNVWKFAICLFLSFICGAWHEGFAAATLGGFLFYTIISRRRFSIQWWCIGIFYAVTTILFYLSPGMLARTAAEIGETGIGSDFKKMIVDFIPVLLVVALIVVDMSIPSFRKYLRESWRNPLFQISTGTVITGVILSLLFTHQPRSAFWPDILSLVMLFILLRPLVEKIANGRFRYYILILLLGMALAPSIYALSFQKEYYEEAKIINEKLKKSDTGTVFHDIIPSAELPFLTLKMPTHNIWITPFNFHALTQYTQKPLTAVVPEELDIADYELKEEKIPGNMEALRIGNSIVAPYREAFEPKVVTVEVTLLSGLETKAVAMLLPYCAPDGQPKVYVNVYKIPSAEITKINLNAL